MYQDIKAGGWDNHQRGFKRIGKIRLGMPMVGRRYPKELDYFRIDASRVFSEKFQELYGEACHCGDGCDKCGGMGKTEVIRSIPVVFPSDDRLRIAPKAFEHWRQSGLRCTGDGEECTRFSVHCSKCKHVFLGEEWRFAWTGKGWGHAQSNLDHPCPDCGNKGKSRGRMILPCENIRCEAFDKGFCKRVMRIHVMCPTVTTSGVFTVETGSGNVMFYTLPQDLDHIESVFGTLKYLSDEDGAPLVVMYREAKVTRQEHKSTHYLVRFAIRSDITTETFKKFRQNMFEIAPTEPVKMLPGPEDIPEELFPREIVEGAKRVSSKSEDIEKKIIGSKQDPSAEIQVSELSVPDSRQLETSPSLDKIRDKILEILNRRGYGEKTVEAMMTAANVNEDSARNMLNNLLDQEGVQGQ